MEFIFLLSQPTPTLSVPTSPVVVRVPTAKAQKKSAPDYAIRLPTAKGFMNRSYSSSTQRKEPDQLPKANGNRISIYNVMANLINTSF